MDTKIPRQNLRMHFKLLVQPIAFKFLHSLCMCFCATFSFGMVHQFRQNEKLVCGNIFTFTNEAATLTYICIVKSSITFQHIQLMPWYVWCMSFVKCTHHP